MQFGPTPIAACAGAILAHSLKVEGRRLKKGHVLTKAEIESLARIGIRELTVARLGHDDTGEDEAAARIAAAIAGPGTRTGAAFTGRANLYSGKSGLALIDASVISAINAVDESITVATVPRFTCVAPRQILATVKIIPFAAPCRAVETVLHAAHGRATIRVAPFVAKSTGLISTVLPTTLPALLGKNRSALDARLQALGSRIVFERRVPHRADDVARAISDTLSEGADPIMIFGAGAIADRNDIVPAAIVQAGGTIEHFGMPVDPGNLLLLGRVGSVPLIGLPSCARSPKRNGFDFVLERLLANLPLSAIDIANMGVGGLLSEIPTRPQPRDVPNRDAPYAPVIAAIVLAAGLSSRMGRNKLLIPLHGNALVRRVVETAIASQAASVVVVTGNEAENIEAALKGLSVTLVHNPDFRAGLSASLGAGIRALSKNCDGAVILLGDMPTISAHLVDRLIAAFDPEEGRAICVASHRGKRGNPVLWAKCFFPDILALEGDTGAKHLISANDEVVWEIESPDDSPLIDIDTPEALAACAPDPK